MREILRELREEGIFDHKGGSGGRGGGKDVDALPNVCVVEVERIDSDGELHARPVKSEAAEGLFPDIFIAPETPSQGALGVGLQQNLSPSHLSPSHYRCEDGQGAVEMILTVVCRYENGGCCHADRPSRMPS